MVGLPLVMLSSCLHTEEEKPEDAKQKVTAEQAAASMGNPLLANKGDINAVNVSVRTEEELENIDNGSEEELVWTDPDHPDAEIPGLNEIFENKKLGLGWQVDMGRAIQLARQNERFMTRSSAPEATLSERNTSIQKSSMRGARTGS